MNRIIQKVCSLLCAGILSITQLNSFTLVHAEEPEHEITYSTMAAEPQAGGINGITYAPLRANYVNALRKGLAKRETPVTFNGFLITDSASDELKLLLKTAYEHTGNPKEGDYIAYQLGSTDIDHTVKYPRGTYKFTPTYNTTAEQEAEVDAAVETLLDELNLSSLSNYKIVQKIYDWISSEVTSASTGSTAYSALISRQADSRGTALLFYRLMLENGIDCRVVYGSYSGRTYFINIVKLGDLYYFIDPSGSTNCFLFGTENMSGFTIHSNFTSSEFRKLYPYSAASYTASEETTDPLERIAIDQSWISLEHEQTLKLNASVLPESASAVLWKSCNPEIASVDEEGNVTGLSEGVTDVIAYTEGSDKIDRCTVTVLKEGEYVSIAYAYASLNGEDYFGIGKHELIFFRSYEDYTDTDERSIVITSSKEPVRDIEGNEYGDGLLFPIDLEHSFTCYDDTMNYELPWHYLNNAFRRSWVAGSQVIRPQFISNWFFANSELTDFDARGFDTSRCLEMTQMFAECTKLEELDLHNFTNDTAKSSASMFYKNKALRSLDISGLSKIQQLSFSLCDSLTELTLGPDVTYFSDKSGLPSGTWTNGDLSMSAEELAAGYMEHAAEWAGTWRREIPVTGVSLQRTMTLNMDASAELKPSFTPGSASNRNVTWTSDNPDVAVVDENGIVTGIWPGTAVITVTTEDGGFTASCTVTVREAAHHYEAPVYTWAADLSSVTASAKCKVDGYELKETAYTTYEVIKAAAEDEDGTGRYTAVFTKEPFETQTKDVRIPKTSDTLPQSITLNTHETSVLYNTSISLRATVGPDTALDKSVTWSSSDVTVAIVGANGTVR
ncbi:MAG: Ig-like domain-containing protein, partial [Erysipelotrichaceae bacterium]|nr:Ig-like domain-containing protein [Erysipelotrichaceae bacterium]